MTTFAVGDVVYLKSGSPPLTVENIRADDKVEVRWWWGTGIFMSAVIPFECLKTTETVQMPNGRVIEVDRG